LAWALIAFYPGHANAQTPGVTGGQDADAIQADRPGEDPDYNGQDFTRPQRSLEFRPEYRTSAGPTSETDQWIEQLRYVNYGDPVPGQTGRLFLPFDAAIGRNVTDKLVVSFEAGVPIIDRWLIAFGGIVLQNSH
jgi:hypothetical protein